MKGWRQLYDQRLVLSMATSVSHRAQSGLIRRDREIRIFGYISFFMHARIISDSDFQTIHLKIITPKKGLFRSNDLISYELVSGDLGLVSVC